MPVRILKPGLTTSLRWNSLGWFEQSFYIRLLTLVDDFGRYDADVRLLKAHAFPLSDDVKLPAIVRACEQLLTCGLAVFYKTESGKPYLALTNWSERVRSASKFPDPSAGNCAQLTAIDSNCLLPTPYALRLTPNANGELFSVVCDEHKETERPTAEDIYAKYPHKVGKPAALRAIEKAMGNTCPACLLSKTVSFSNVRGGNVEYCPNPATWFNQQRFNDDPSTWVPKTPATQKPKEKYVYRCV